MNKNSVEGSCRSSVDDDSLSYKDLMCIITDMKKANIIKTRRIGLVRVYRNAFSGENFVNWIIRDRKLSLYTLTLYTILIGTGL